MMYGKADLF